MRSIIKLLSAPLFAIALLAAVVTTAGCDEDRMWDTASDPNGQYLLLGLLTLRGDVYAVTITVEGLDTNESWADLVISVGGKTYTLSSIKPLAFNIRSLAELISIVAVTRSPATYSCSLTETPILSGNQLSINILCTTAP